MEENIVKLVNLESQIRSLQGTYGDNIEQYESCKDILRCLIDEVQQSRKRKWCEQQLQIENKLEKATQTLMKTLRVQKRQYIRNRQTDSAGIDTRTSCSADESIEMLINLSQNLITELKLKPDDDEIDTMVDGSNADNDSNVRNASGMPSSVQEYKSRLVQYNKELYKNPPVMPPLNITVIENMNKLPPKPQRDPKTRRLTFYMPFESIENQSNYNINNIVVTDFHPNVTPEEILFDGAFGGTYFRNIHSAVTNEHYIGINVIKETLAPEWLSKFDKKAISTKLTSSTYRPSVNKFKAKCGGSLGMWESSGWISNIDPYGWFQWYCRFYRGRRSSDDVRQISRWKSLAGPKGRFKSQVCNKILQKASIINTSMNKEKRQNAMIDAINDVSISPVIRQTLFHWGLIVTGEVLNQHQKKRSS